MANNKRLIVITGPTGVGKTRIAIRLAQILSTEIISADSRQIYRGIPICSAVPSAEEQKAARHHFVEILDLDRYYSAAQFETDALNVIARLFRSHDDVIMCGGSMMYVDAVCKGIDNIPTISPSVRNAVIADFQANGIEWLHDELRRLDPCYYNIVDRNNTKRLIHAIEICRQAGCTYSSLRTGTNKQRPFSILKLGINMPRHLLFDSINSRVDRMVAAGLEQEARSVLHLRHLNSLNTVGIKEMFAYFDGTMDFTTAVERIKKNTRVYAKKQLTWYAKDSDIIWKAPDSHISIDHPELLI